ncbi:MAG: hypothetical protein RLZZ319_400 [Actinomycetota bacterium]|jgi:hypothetical protein
MNILRRTLAVGAIAVVALLTSGCYELHINADVDQKGHVTSGNLEMSMAKETFDTLAAMGGQATKGGLAGFEELVNNSSSSEGSPAAGQYINGCTYSEKTVDSADYYSAVCAFDAADLEGDVTVDQVLGLTGGETVVSGGTLTVTGTMPDTSNGDQQSMDMAASMGLTMDTTLHFANNVVSVEGDGVEIDASDPTSVIVNNLAGNGSDIAIVVEVPSDNTVIIIASVAGVAVLGLAGWLVYSQRKKKSA